MKAIEELRNKLVRSAIPHQFLQYPTGRYHIEIPNLGLSIYEGSHYCMGDSTVAIAGLNLLKTVPNKYKDKNVYLGYSANKAFNIICNL